MSYSSRELWPRHGSNLPGKHLLTELGIDVNYLSYGITLLADLIQLIKRRASMMMALLHESAEFGLFIFLLWKYCVLGT
jgi:hypothetical protein